MSEDEPKPLRLKTNNNRFYFVPIEKSEEESEKMIKTLKEWKEESVKIAHGNWSSDLEAVSFPWWIRDYAEKYLSKFEVSREEYERSNDKT